MSIPRIIHYCWFGNKQKPQDVQYYLNGWQEVLKDYQIIEWNDANFVFNDNEFAKESYNKGIYAFVSDYARLKVLYEYGGIYLDTDVEVKKKFDPLLNDPMFIGFMFDCNLGTAVIGVEKHNPFIKQLLSLYEDKQVEISPNNGLFTNFFLENFADFKLNGKYQKLTRGIVVYPKEYFERATFNKNIDYTDHHHKGSWRNRQDGITKKMAKLLLGKVLYGKIVHYKAVRISPFYHTYVKHSRR